MGAFSTLPASSLAEALYECNEKTIAIIHDASVDVSATLAALADGWHRAGEATLVIGVDEASCERMRRAGVRDACVASMESVCLGILGDARVRDKTRRDARIIDVNEYDVLLEDLKVSGLKPRRLREMTKFFLKSLSEYANESEGWLVTPEEQLIFALLEENLEARRAVLPCEAASLAYRGLIETGIDIPKLSIAVDDYGALSKSQQRLVRLLADRLVAAGAEAGAGLPGQPYPFYEGFSVFSEQAERSIRVSCESRPGVLTKRYETPIEEFAGVEGEVARLLGEGYAPEDILIAVPHPLWAARIAERLASREIPVARIGEEKTKGDPRDALRCASLKRAAFLKLWRNPDDMTALRSWVGFGDWLVRSDAFMELLAYARERNMSALDALRMLRTQLPDQREALLFAKFDAALDELDEVVDSLRSASGHAAVAIFEEHGMPLDARRIALLGDLEGPADIDALVADGSSVRHERASGVRIARYEDCCAEHARVTVACGLVGGFLPRLDALDEGYTIDHKKRAMARDGLLFDDVCATSSELLVLSLFERDLLENADALHMRLRRVFVKDGVRCASIEPSVFLADYVFE